MTKYQTCYVAFEEFLTGKGRLVGFGCMIATAVCLLNIITICCICFHPTKTKKDNFYQRMMEDD